MTITSDTRKAGPYPGNGVTTQFPFGFKVFKKDDVLVTFTDGNGADSALTLDSDYSVTLNEDQNNDPGGTITYPRVGSLLAVLDNTQRLTLTGGLPYTQPTDIPNLSPFFPEVVEDAFDRAEIQIQQLKEVTDRSIKISVSDTPLQPLPAQSARGNTVIGFDATGNLTVLPIPSSLGAGDRIPFTLVAGVDFVAGVSTQVTLPRAPGTPGNLEIFFDPLFQGFDQWTVNGLQVTFSNPIPVGVTKIFGYIGTTLSTQIPPLDSVGEDQLTWGDGLLHGVNSIAELRAITSPKFTRVRTAGYDAAGDGGHGEFAVDPTDTTSADNGVSVIVATNGRRFKLQQWGSLRAKQAGAKFDGVTNDTVALNRALTAAANMALAGTSGTRVEMPAGTAVISGPLNVPGNVEFYGQGIDATILSCTTAMGVTTPAVFSSGSNVAVRDFSILGNTNGANGAGYGIHFKTGSKNIVQHVAVRDTTQCGLRMEEQTFLKVYDNYLLDCGRTGYSDNHGMMFFTITAAPTSDIDVRGNTVINAFRKGIATFANPGPLDSLRIEDNLVSNCDTGGIYIGGAVAATHTGIIIRGNVCLNNYNNIDVGQVNDVVISDNWCFGTSGGDGMTLSALGNFTVSGNIVRNSVATGINLINSIGPSQGGAVIGNTVVNSNRGVFGYAPAINLSSVVSTTVTGNTCFDTGGAVTTHGIYENTGSDFNTISGNQVRNISSGVLVNITGQNSTTDEALEFVRAVANGANDNVLMPAGGDSVLISMEGPTLAYSITSILARPAGSELNLLNNTAQTLSLFHNNGAASPPANRLVLPGNATYTVPAFGCVKLKWSARANGWVVSA